MTSAGAHQHQQPLRYVLMFAVTVAVCFTPLGVGAAFLWRSGELISLQRAVAIQQSTRAIVGLASYQNFFKYKEELVRQRHPSVLVLGSSRTMQFREESFSEPFVTAGGAMNSLEEGLLFLNQLNRADDPRILVVGLDYWWFHPSANGSPNHSPDDADQLTLFRMLAALRWLIEGRIGPGRFAHILLSADRANPYTNDQGFGILGIESASGFRRDGSYQYGNHYFGLYDRLDIRFATNLSRLEQADQVFPRGPHVGSTNRETFDGIVQWAASRRVALVFVLPPLAPPVFARMAALAGEFGYVDELRRLGRDLANGSPATIEFYDFLAGPTGNDPCEFVDGLHGGDVTFQRILLDILRANPQSVLRNVVDVPRVRETIGTFRGHAVSVLPPTRFMRPEVDFLQLGCTK